jgi:hypothetical protein
VDVGIGISVGVSEHSSSVLVDEDERETGTEVLVVATMLREVVVEGADDLAGVVVDKAADEVADPLGWLPDDAPPRTGGPGMV